MGRCHRMIVNSIGGVRRVTVQTQCGSGQVANHGLLEVGCPGYSRPMRHTAATLRAFQGSAEPRLVFARSATDGSTVYMHDGEAERYRHAARAGELICIELDVGTGQPSDRNDFKGEATTITSINQNIDANKYNAIGIKAIEGRQFEPTNVLNIGGPDAEYGVFNETVDPPRFGGCPNVITLNHFFDGANVLTHERSLQGTVNSELTVVPCERDYLNQTANGLFTTIQFLIFNEFEQRFSASTKVNCYKEVQLSDIDTVPGPGGNTTSIFSVGTQGTLTGMSRLRSVAGPNLDGYDGRTILAVLTENWAAGICEVNPPVGVEEGRKNRPEVTLCSSDADCIAAGVSDTCNNPFVKTTASNVQFQGSRLQGDRITIPAP